MTAIILAAGMGSRLVPMTETRPKCLVKVNGKSILEYQIEAYRDAGVTRIVVVAGYFASRLQAFLAPYGSLVECVVNEDYESTNNMYSLYLALSKITSEGVVFVSNGDVVLDKQIIERLVGHEGSAMAIDKGSYDAESMKVIVEGGFVQAISKEIREGEAYGNSIDVYKFEGTFLDVFTSTIRETIEREKNLKDWTEVALDKALKSLPMCVQPMDIDGARWTEVDNYDDLQVADRKFSDLDINAVEFFFVDMDGTLISGDRVVAGAGRFIEQLKRCGSTFKLLSNNSSKSKSEYVAMLTGFGISVSESDIVLSSDAAIAHLCSAGITSVYVLGTEALRIAAEGAGLRTTGEDFECVLVGYDTELTYAKLKQAALLLHDVSVRCFATHSDMVCPTPEGAIPDVGTTLSVLKQTTGREPERVFGKPDPSMVEFLIRAEGVAADKVAFIGDRVYTDMQAARNLGGKFILVLSGETQRGDVDAMADFPDLIVPSVADLCLGGACSPQSK